MWNVQSWQKDCLSFQINWVEQSPFSEATICSDIQGIPSYISQNPVCLCRFQKIPPLVHILSQINPFHIITYRLFWHIFSFSNLSLYFLSCLLHFSFRHQIPISISIVHFRATYPTQLIPLDLSTIRVFSEEQRKILKILLFFFLIKVRLAL